MDCPEGPAIAGGNETPDCQAAVPGPGKALTRRDGVTLSDLAEKLNLPLSFLAEQGLVDGKRGGLPAVRIPYADAQGNTLAIHWLVDLQRGRERFEMRKGDKPSLYGLWKLDEIQLQKRYSWSTGCSTF